MVYGTETISPVAIVLPSPCRLQFSEVSNDELRRRELDFLDERRDDSQWRPATYQMKMMRYYSTKINKRSFRINDLVIQRVFLSSKEPEVCILGPN